MKIEVFEKARVLGEELASSAEFKQLQLAQAAYEADGETQTRMEELGRLTEEIQARSEEFVTLAQLEELRGEVAQLRGEIDTMPSVARLMSARGEFQGLMDEVNEVIRFVISGEAADAYHNACMGCAGCHQVH